MRVDDVVVTVPRHRLAGGEAIVVAEGAPARDDDRGSRGDRPRRSSTRTTPSSCSTSRRASSCIPGSGNRDGTLLNALLHHAPALAALPRARHRASPGQGHERPHGRRQDAGGANRASCASSRRAPSSASISRWSTATSRAPPRSTRPSAAIRRSARRWRWWPPARPRARTWRSSSASATRRSCAAVSRPAARTRSACISRRSDIRWSAIRPIAAGAGRRPTRFPQCTRSRGRRCMRSGSGSCIR